MSYKRISAMPVVEGGTGAITLTGVLTGNGTSAVTANAVTQHGVLIAGASNAVSSLGVAASSTVLQGSTGADPAFTATPTVTSITFGAGSALSTFNDWTNFTPTIIGESVAGSTTYNNQQGRYCRVGNMVVCQIDVRSATMTGTGNLNIGGLPFTIANVIVSSGAVSLGGTITWPAGTTSIAVYGVTNTTTARINCSGSAVGTGFLQMTNTAVNIFAQITYAV